jgi:ferredoxin
MPWVKKEDCVGCGICVDQCPVGSITLRDAVASIDMASCIHCGVCHTACPKGAVRHDSEKIPEEVRENVNITKGFMEDCVKYFGSEDEKQKCLVRMIKHFIKERIVAEKTLQELQTLLKKYNND